MTTKTAAKSTFKCRYCKRTIDVAEGEHLPNDRCMEPATHKLHRWHLWKFVTQVEN
jgi:hypothetical protein